MIDITDHENKNHRQYENWIRHPIALWGVLPMPEGEERFLPLLFHAQEVHSEELRRRVKFNTVTPFLLGLWRQGAFGSDAPEMVFEGDLIGPRPRTLRITYRRRDEDTLTSNTELQYLGIYQPADNSVLRRKTGDRE